jgi:hypothetical protein
VQTINAVTSERKPLVSSANRRQDLVGYLAAGLD